jgi:predicted nucleic acid-binding protein
VRIYLDASPVMYYVEGTAPFAALVAARINAPGEVLVASDLTRLETLVLPVRVGDAQRVRDFEDFFAQRVAEMVPFTRAVFDRALDIRVRENFRVPDALHLAAAVEARCDLFLTNDAQLRRFAGIAVEVV